MRQTYARDAGTFRFGVGTSAYQTEGGLTAATWAAWERARRPKGQDTIRHGDRSGIANDAWNRFDEDLAALVWLGVDVYRFSVEWSRVEPLPGFIDDDAVQRYRDWCVRLRSAGISPMVTLHHFSEPAWFAHAGGFTDATAARAWVRFVELIATRLGDVVDEWITVNEPVGYVVQGWLRGIWPPGRTDAKLATQVLEHVLLAHADAYRTIHRLAEARGPDAGRACRVGVAHHIATFRPRRPHNPLDVWATRVVDRNFNHAVPAALRTGELRIRLPGIRHRSSHRALVATQDFFGLNHYHVLRASLQRPSGSHLPVIEVGASPTGEKGDLGVDIDVDSLAGAVRAVAVYGLPVEITEHGTCDGDDPDERRARHLLGAVRGVERLVREGLDVRSYVHWTLADSFEWAYGWDARFGLFSVDRETLERCPRPSAFRYRELIRQHREVRRPVGSHDADLAQAEGGGHDGF